MKIKKLHTIAVIVLSFIFLYSCQAFKYKPVSAKDFPPEPSKRVKKNIEEGRGFTVMDGLNKKTTYEFASSNPLWRASLDTLDFMPLATANYSGGIIVTDWYNDDSSENESVKISVRFLSNEIRSDALDINIFTKKCDERNNCTVIEGNNEIVTSLKKSILKKAAKFEDSDLAKKRKENTYKREIKD